MDRIKKVPLCFLCKRQFSFPSNEGFRSEDRRPLVLGCGHSVCFQCLINEVKAPGDAIQCLTCQQTFTASSRFSATRPHAEFPINYFLLSLSYCNNNKPDDSTIAFSKPKPSKKITKIVACDECSERKADFNCRDCKSPYCSPCFTKVHNAARAFRDHVKADLVAPLDGDSFSDVCPDHSDEPQTFWCEQCHQVSCARCIFSKHQGHDKVMPLQEKNESCVEELMEAHVKVSNILERLKATKKKGCSAARSEEDEDGPLQLMVMDHFSRLHGLLVLRQQELLTQLLEPASLDSSHSLRPLLTQMDTSIEKIATVLERSNYVMLHKQSLLKTAPYPILLDKLREAHSTPCHLITNEDRATSFCIDLDEGIFDVLRKHGSVENTKEEGRYKLVSEDELPPDFPPEPVGREFTVEMLTKSLTSREMSRSSSMSESSVHSSSSLLEPTGLTLADQPHSYYDELLPGTKIRATISHSTSPSNFYIHRLDFKKKLKEIETQIGVAMKANTKRVQDIRIKQLYIVRYDTDFGWYRGRIMDRNGDKVQVHYIDYGNEETVNVNSVRWMPQELALLEPLAIPCCLHDCHPRGSEWDPRALTTMLSIMGTDVMMVVKKKTSSRLFVNVYQTNISQGTFSLADSLTFLGLASNFKQRSFEEREVGENIRKIEPDTPLPDGSVTQVKVVHVENPSNFYVQTEKQEAALERIMCSLQDFCGRKTDKLVVYCPHIGMSVSAKCSRDDKWYRAEVVDKPLPKFVIVHYIDFGFKEQINWQRMRLLPQQFFKYKRQCHNCSLLDVAPIIDKRWTKSATEAFVKNAVNVVDSSRLTMVTQSFKDGFHQVVLHNEMGGSDSICINTILVKVKAAISTGVNSKVLQFHRGLYEDNNEGNKNSEDTVNPPAAEVVQKPFNQDKNLKIKPEVVAAEEVKVVSQPKPNAVLTEVPKPSAKLGPRKSDAVKSNFKVAVEIVKICSPSEFYISYSKSKSKVNMMIADMQPFYEQNHESLCLDEVKERSTCVVKNESGEWCRALVLAIPDGHFLVRLIDYGDKIQVDRVYHLNEKFIKVMDGAIQCHLGGLKEPFENEWPLTATDELKEVARNNSGKLFIAGMGESKKGCSLAVELFCQEILAAKAFEPMSVKWTSFNNFLRKKGLALPDGTTNWDVEESYIQFGNKKAPVNKMNDSLKYFDMQQNAKEVPCSSPEGMSKLDLVVVRDCQPGVPDILPRLPPEMPIMPSAWPTPLPFDSLSFIASATNVDYDGQIFIQDFHKSVVTLKRLDTELESHCKLTEPNAFDMFWTIGDTCIARYHLDKKWYRGIVKQVLNENIFSINFVDYGNVEECNVTDLRKKALMTDVPIQGRFCKIKGIRTARNQETWPIPDLDKIHALVVDKHCHVKLELMPDGSYEIETMILPSGENLQDHLVKSGIAQFVQDPNDIPDASSYSMGGASSQSDDEMVVEMEMKLGTLTICGPSHQNEDSSRAGSSHHLNTVEEEDLCQDSLEPPADPIGQPAPVKPLSEPTTSTDQRNKAGTSFLQVPSALLDEQESADDTENTLSDVEEYEPEFSFLDMPDINSSFTVDIGAILAPNKVSFQIIDCHDYAFSASRESFLALEEEMQSKATQQPPLENLEPGLPCCALFTSDNKWYRGKILEVNVEADTLLVQYVDYGNVERLSSNQVRKMKDHWMLVDVQGFEALLENVDSSSKHETSLLSAMIDSLIGEKLYAKVTRQNPLTVELYSDSSLSTLAYQNLIDKKLLELIEEES